MSIEISGLSHSYGELRVLENISLTVKAGESIGIIGESGGGKSTLLKLISGLYEVRIGEISILGARESAGRRKLTAMVMQGASLLPASIRDNITCGREIDDATVWRALSAARLAEWISALPEGIDTFVGERGGQVSGGQAQRIAIARAIVKDAPVVLLDEPTSALDGDTGVAVLTALANLCRGKAVVHVSHRIETLSDCDRVLKLAGGRLHDL